MELAPAPKEKWIPLQLVLGGGGAFPIEILKEGGQGPIGNGFGGMGPPIETLKGSNEGSNANGLGVAGAFPSIYSREAIRNPWERVLGLFH